MNPPNKTPNPPDERLEIFTPKQANVPDERLQIIIDPATEHETKFESKFETIIKSLTTYKPDQNAPSGGWWFSQEVEPLDNDNWGWKAFPPTQKPEWVSVETWIRLLGEFAKGQPGDGTDEPLELSQKGYKFLTRKQMWEIQGDEEKNRMLFINPASTYVAPGYKPKF